MKLTITCKDGQTIEIDYTKDDFPDTLREMWAEQGKSEWYRIEGEK